MTEDGQEGVTIRPISYDEVEHLIRLWSEAGLPIKPEGRDTIENLRTQFLESPDLFIGAFAEGIMIAVVMGSDDGRKGWINRLAVMPEWRRCGIASTLIEACEAALRRRGRQIICTLIEEYNDVSKDLFVASGYKREDEIIYYAKRDSDGV